jgi:hypothetical protein
MINASELKVQEAYNVASKLLRQKQEECAQLRQEVDQSRALLKNQREQIQALQSKLHDTELAFVRLEGDHKECVNALQSSKTQVMQTQSQLIQEQADKNQLESQVRA